VRILVVNAGSSSLKLRLLDGADRVVWNRQLPAREGRFDVAALSAALHGLAEIDAVGHRVVHGGARLDRAALVDDALRDELAQLAALAPLHQPAALRALDAARERFPDVSHYCCFDTAFHATLSPAARTYALPRPWREAWGLRRFGFHGLSHAWVARRVALLAADAARSPRIVSCHLGAGASVCAIDGGRSVDTSMGFTPLAGLPMATRCGDVDPGVLLWLLRSTSLDVDALARGLNEQSGLLGLAGSGDMRTVLERAQRGDVDARLALDAFAHRLRAAIAAMAAAMGGIDVLAFTGGVGERAAAVRQAAADGLGFLGVGVDGPRNERTCADGDISAADARARTLVVQAREDAEIARQGRELLLAAT